MRKLSIASLIIACCFEISTAQVPAIGVFRDSTAANCNLVDTYPGTFKAYVVVISPVLIRAVQFAAPKPPCFTGVYIADELVFPLAIGNSQTGISIAINGCWSSPLHVLTIIYQSFGTTPPCCWYPILPEPESGVIGFVDCSYEFTIAEGLQHTINGNTSCFCGIDPPPEVPSNPSPVHKSANNPITTRLSWESSDPENDPLTYDMYFGTDPNPTLIASDLLQSSYDPGLLEYGKTYYWKVAAKDDKWNVVHGPVWSFKTQATSSSRFVVSSSLNYCGSFTGDTVEVDLLLENTPVAIEAGGVDISYDSAQLTFLACSCGDLTAGWQQLDCADLGTHIRIGGFDPEPIPAGSFGSFARLVFLSDCCGGDSAVTVDLCPENLTDDLRLLFPVCGEFRCARFTADGDVNGNGSITPEDALCAFRAYLSFPDAPETGCAADGWDVRSDVDCNGQITPGDALCIFENWLDGSCTFCGLLSTPPSHTPPDDRAVISIGDIRLDGTDVTVVLDIAGVPSLDAFGFEVLFPSSGLEYLGNGRTALSQDFAQLDGALVEAGRLRLGGYCTDAVAAARQTDLVELRFRMLADELEGKLAIHNYVDDVSGAETVEADLRKNGDPRPVFNKLALYQNYPNPFNPGTEIRYEIPDGKRNVRVRLSIFNIEGKLIRTLVDAVKAAGPYREWWDGRNQQGEEMASGVYFCVLSAGDETLGRKMVLVR